jgi:hypothetical protein
VASQLQLADARRGAIQLTLHGGRKQDALVEHAQHVEEVKVPQAPYG